MDSLKRWWNDDGRSIFGTWCVATVLFTIAYVLIWGVNSALSWTVNVIGLAWIIRSWLIIAFVWTGYEVFKAYEAFRVDPDAWMDEEDEHVP